MIRSDFEIIHLSEIGPNISFTSQWCYGHKILKRERNVLRDSHVRTPRKINFYEYS